MGGRGQGGEGREGGDRGGEGREGGGVAVMPLMAAMPFVGTDFLTDGHRCSLVRDEVAAWLAWHDCMAWLACRVHGRNRLGGNSLLECVVFGCIAGKEAASGLNV